MQPRLRQRWASQETALALRLPRVWVGVQRVWRPARQSTRQQLMQRPGWLHARC
jgi:hypothetical protein